MDSKAKVQAVSLWRRVALTGKKFQISRQKERVTVPRPGSAGKQDGSQLVVPFR